MDTLAGDTVGTGPRLQLSTAGDLTGWTEELENAMNRREQRFRFWANAVQLAQKLKI
ncbi:MAG: hypothetical protein SPK17_00145 [Treponema sp.]|nr:hypothetical protein [Treponema sp.]